MTQRITQSIAEMVTSNLMAKKYKEIEAARKEYEKQTKSAYLSAIPKAVMSLWKLHPEWMEGATTIRIDGNGFKNESVSFEGQLPKMSGDYYGRTFKPEKDVAADLILLKNRYEKLQDKSDKLRRELRAALLTAGSYKKVIEMFPEAKKFLPDNALGLVVNADKIREELKDIPTTV